MSTDHQQYSLHNQSEYIKDYAEKNNMEIAYTYDDAGKSGVSIVGRHSLQQLLEPEVTVESFTEILLSQV
ncbi:recombinase family protein [Escherichia coli]|nr:recombinase family protein [Escherichia coli]